MPKKKKAPPSAKSTNDNEGGSDGAVVTFTRTKKVARPSTRAAAAAAHATTDDVDDVQQEEGSVEVGACCLCHCALDYSDRAAFFKKDREEDYGKDDDDDDSYFFRPYDPYLPVELYDKANALVYCDECDRMYHQKCHFVPLTVLPRGSWVCLFCQSLNKMNQSTTTSTTSVATTTSGRKSKKKQQQQQSKKELISKQQLLKQQQQQEEEQREWQKIMAHAHEMFRSPPVASAKPWELKWEHAVRKLKASVLRTELSQRLKQAVANHGSNYRLAETAIITLTSTQKNLAHFSTPSRSQELAQTLVKLYGARLGWRELCFSLDKIRRSTNETWHQLLQFVQQHEEQLKANTGEDDGSKQQPSDYVQRVIFPFGTQHPRRIEPRTAEMKKALTEQGKEHAIPTEILLVSSSDDTAKKRGSSKKASPRRQSSRKKTAGGKKEDDDESHGGISLDNLQCCVCYGSHATDENDLIMCDSAGCYRAYHYQCLQPELTQQKMEQENVDDWFCPLCLALSKSLLAIQTEYMGDEWAEARLNRQWYGKKKKAKKKAKKKGDTEEEDDDDDESTYKSWDKPQEVFPTVEQDYAAALQMKEGKRNKATDDLLARVLGRDQLSDHDSDDEMEDQHWNLEEFEQERKRQYNKAEADEDEVEGNCDGDESSHSSQATLVEMSSVELEIGKRELDALSRSSSVEGDDEDDGTISGDSNGPSPVRRSRRLRVANNNNSSHPSSNNNSTSGGGGGGTANNSLDNMGEFDTANILEGKRGRKPVDYIRLNDSLFGSASEHEKANLDDADDFEATGAANTAAGDVAGGNDSDCGAGSDEEAGGDEDASEQPPSSDEKESTSKKTRNRANSSKPEKPRAGKSGTNGKTKKTNGRAVAKKRKSTTAKPAASTKRKGKSGSAAAVVTRAAKKRKASKSE